MMTMMERAKFEVALQDLAKAHGLELVEVPAWSYGPYGTGPVKSGTALWTVYGRDGSPTEGFAVEFRPRVSASSATEEVK